MHCEICGSAEFKAGFQGRLTNGIPPTCAGCGSSERHRIVFNLMSAIRPLMKDWRVLQFAPDRSVNKEWFKYYFGSIYGTATSLDMMDTGLDAQSYDLVISNHVLEHVPDDIKALQESLRVVGSKGLVALTVPTPIYRWSTVDWQFADETKNLHYRDYGADFANNIVNTIIGLHALVAVNSDPVTGIGDHVNFFSYNEELLSSMANIWQRKPIPLVHIFRN